MIITCEKCGGSFKLDEKLLKPGGTKVRCSTCKHIFSAFPPDAPKAAAVPSENQLVLCEQCGAGFNVKATLLKADGTKVRCSKCKHIFLAFPSAAPAVATEALAMEPPVTKVVPKEVPKKATAADWSLDESAADEVAPSTDEMDLSLDEEEAGGGLSLDEDDTGSGLSLDLEEDAAAAGAPAAEDELDLSLDEDDTDTGLSLDLEDESQPASGSEDELELDLDTDDSEPGLSLETETSPTDDGKTDDLELALEEGEEIDFSEVDNLLESEDTSAAKTVKEPADDLSLSLDDEGGGAGSGIEQQEIDLADLEQTIEMELLESEEDTERDEPEDVELALADDDEDEDEDQELTLGEGEDADLSDIEEMLAVGEDEETIELDLEGEEEGETAAAGDEKGAPAAGKDKKEKGAKKKKEKKVKAKKEKAEKTGGKSSKKGLLIALVVLLLLAALGAGFWYVYKTTGFSSLFNNMGQSTPVRTNKVSVMENTIQSDFVNNTQHGKLLIVRGSVKNDTAAAKRFIKVVANLYSEGRKLEMTSAAYCGNILTNDELATSDLAAINARLAVPAGNNNSNAAVKPGMTIPFMIVISEMPEKLVEYEVMVTESAPVA